MIPTCQIIIGDCIEQLRKLPAESVHCVVTSPPYYGLRDYGMKGQIGLEKTPAEFLRKLVEVFEEVRRVLRKDGTCWVNMGDSYAGSWGAQGRSGAMANRSVIAARQIDSAPKRVSKAGTIPGGCGLKPKDMMGMPWRLAFALQDAGWYLRQDIIWSKPNPMPESVQDRCCKSHEYLFLLTKSARYHWEADAIAEAISDESRARYQRAVDNAEKYDPTRHKNGDSSMHNSPMEVLTRAAARVAEKGTRTKRSVWTVPTMSFSGAHFATYPPDLVKPCILAGCPAGGTVLDPFGGSGTTGLVALELGRSAILLELNPEYAAIAKRRCDITPGFNL
ncbi:site-specific DNA-methyltransferase [Luteolibacter pohnpeiensis]|uniref:Methyltransferase n=1 Tax=Luteolibacter pohnpeiensis TaxID=454153 RepID=A0A934VWV9_9BACT|nr:site-specific DNA-methyltransferase [Luteolibacter pohnpeiensis]MBK1883685.1 site-specific DNA-methyltransferase [Luteolibacter pohnpeiensis]